MTVVILVPWRTDDGTRAKVWEVCRSRWEALFPDWAIYEGRSPEGPFNRSAAINDAAQQAGAWDVALVIDADVLLPKANVLAAVERAAASGLVTWAHRRWRSISQEATERLIGPKGEAFAEGALGPGGFLAPAFTADIDLIVDKTTRLSWSCCIAIRRDAWETVGGYDERFIGWGHEDGAFSSAVMGLVGHDRIEGDVLNLWHPRSPGAGMADRDGRNRWTPQALANGRLGMRYMVALRRDHGLSDRPEPSSPEVIERDIRNLVNQDEAYAAQQTPEARKAFDGHWPTLTELVAEASAYRAELRTGQITVVVHTGGRPDAWPERREYIIRSIASLDEQVTGPIVKRVIYDLWGDDTIRSWLRETFPAYNVVGPTPATVEAVAEDVLFTWGMQQMWTYLGRHTKGDYVFAVEDDFTYERPVDLAELVNVLRSEPKLVQVALLRDACYGDEKDGEAIGNILGWPRPAFTFRDGWFEHRLFFTLNPTLFRKSLTTVPWPSGHHSETIFGKRLLADKSARSAFMGDGSEWIRHIGQVRAGSGY